MTVTYLPNGTLSGEVQPNFEYIENFAVFRNSIDGSITGGSPQYAGPPTVGYHTVGDSYIDSSGVQWICNGNGQPGSWYQVGSSIPPNIQNGVSGYSDFTSSGLSINTGTCALTVTLAAANPYYVKSVAGILAAASYGGGSTTQNPGAPAATKYAVIGFEADAGGNISAVKGVDTATVLNTASLIVANSPPITAGKMRVLDVSVFNNSGTYQFGNSTTVPSAGVNYVDRRPWSRGAYGPAIRIANATGGTDYTTTSSTFVPVDAANLAVRIECTGVPVLISCISSLGPGSLPWVVSYYMNGSLPSGQTPAGYAPNYGSAIEPLGHVARVTPPAGSNLFQLAWKSQGGTALMYARADLTVTFVIEEILKVYSGNGSA